MTRRGNSRKTLDGRFSSAWDDQKLVCELQKLKKNQRCVISVSKPLRKLSGVSEVNKFLMKLHGAEWKFEKGWELIGADENAQKKVRKLAGSYLEVV